MECAGNVVPRFLRRNHDGIRLRRRDDSSPDLYRDHVDRWNKRLAVLAAEENVDGDARWLTKHMRKHAEYIFTFLDYDHVAFENSFAERQIRPTVILRKNSQSNRSEQGAAPQEVLISVYRTLRLRALDPTKTIADALKPT